jgi:TDG/mug DNA glycosylase family protein
MWPSYHFSHRNNRFWPVLQLAGFTDVRLQPADQRRLLDYGCGVTAVVRRPTRSASEVSPEEYRRYSSGFAGAEVWVLPNPSGLNLGFSLDQLVDAYSELRQALSASESEDPEH